MNVSSSEDEDDYTITWTIREPMHEQNVNKLDTYVPGENWYTQNGHHFVHLTLQGEQNVEDKVPPTNFTIDLIALSPPIRSPRLLQSP